MKDPYTLLSEYISKILDSAWEAVILSNSRFRDAGLKVIWNIKSNNDAWDFSTALPFKIASLLKTKPIIISQMIVDNIFDYNNYFSLINAKEGYINLTIANHHFNNLIHQLRNWLISRPSPNGEVEISYILPSHIIDADHYRTKLFVEAKSNVFKQLGYSVVVISSFNRHIDKPLIQYRVNHHEYSSYVETVNVDSFSWNKITNLYTEPALNFCLLATNINKPVVLDQSNLALHHRNPLYLVSYIQNRISNELKHHKTPSDLQINPVVARKLITYPKVLQDSLSFFEINNIFHYIIYICRLTFDHDLWQNCIEKKALLPIILEVLNHSLNMVNCSFLKTS